MDIIVPLLRATGEFFLIYLVFPSACVLAGYLLGNLQSGVIVSRIMGKGDLRLQGSNASGTTNAWRVLGKKAAVYTFLGDFAKGLLATWIGTMLSGRDGGLIAGVFVIAGHIWPVFFDWHGGKGVASTLGVLLLLQPIYALVYAVILLVSIGIRHMVSLGSVTGACLILILNTILCLKSNDWMLLAFGVLVSGMILFAHRSNIRRLLNGSESLTYSPPLRKDQRRK